MVKLLVEPLVVVVVVVVVVTRRLRPSRPPSPPPSEHPTPSPRPSPRARLPLLASVPVPITMMTLRWSRTMMSLSMSFFSGCPHPTHLLLHLPLNVRCALALLPLRRRLLLLPALVVPVLLRVRLFHLLHPLMCLSRCRGSRNLFGICAMCGMSNGLLRRLWACLRRTLWSRIRSFYCFFWSFLTYFIGTHRGHRRSSHP